ncbi:unnamed protein product, partial [marine sediment metagenome]
KKLESPLFSEDLTGDWPWAKEKKKAKEVKTNGDNDTVVRKM